VALIASLRKICRQVVGIGRSLIVLQVAAYTSCTRQVVVVVDVAVGALPRRYGVASAQRKSNRRVVEARVKPRIGAMASRAIRREGGLHMAWIRGRFKICCVARVALRRHRLELAAGGTFVTRVAIHRCVCSGQRETVIVLLDLLHGYLPAADGVALFTIRAELTPVDVGVAVLTPLSKVREHRLDMALDASHRLVHAAQRVFSLIVIEFRNRPNRFPGVRRVAILAGNIQISVRTMRPLGHLRSRWHSAQYQGEQHKKVRYAPRCPHLTSPLRGHYKKKR